jgi:hypothetical protein
MALAIFPKSLKINVRINGQFGTPRALNTAGNGMIASHVMQVAPALRDGGVTVDVKQKGALPTGSRPGLTRRSKFGTRKPSFECQLSMSH